MHLLEHGDVAVSPGSGLVVVVKDICEWALVRENEID